MGLKIRLIGALGRLESAHRGLAMSLVDIRRLVGLESARLMGLESARRLVDRGLRILLAPAADVGLMNHLTALLTALQAALAAQVVQVDHLAAGRHLTDHQAALAWDLLTKNCR